MLENLVFYQ